MTGDPQPPPIPIRLATRPTIGGLVVPWVSGQGLDGRYRLGTADADRSYRSLAQRLCQTCGQPLDPRVTFAMRDSDIARLISPEPGMHPECARYSGLACPMLTGQISHYRSSSAVADLADPAVLSHDPPSTGRPGAPAPAWNLVWVSQYRYIRDPATGQHAAALLPEHILRFRPIGASR